MKGVDDAMNIILFGPPGVGKSTLIGILKSNNVRAIDLEDVYPSKIRFQLPNMVDHVVLGGADLDPKRSYHNAKKVVLSLPQDAYDARRSARDARVKGKANQRRHLIDDWMTGVQYDLVLDASGSPNATASALVKYLKEVDK
jgi:hypothetical protein